MRRPAAGKEDGVSTMTEPSGHPSARDTVPRAPAPSPSPMVDPERPLLLVCIALIALFFVALVLVVLL